MDSFAALRAISPLDGRYGAQLFELSAYFSEYALFKYRLFVEVEYLIELCALGLEVTPSLSQAQIEQLRGWAQGFSFENAAKIKEIERTTNHDIKALEYYIRTELEQMGLAPFKAWVHFGLTSQDINNTAIPLSLKAFLQGHYLPTLGAFVTALNAQAQSWSQMPMLAHTHGQPASPTYLGKEMAVFAERLALQADGLATTVSRMSGKFGGATGNFNAHKVAFPAVDWPAFADRLLSRLGLVRQQTTTQIEHYDGLGEVCHHLERINTILLDFCRDMWSYISFNYFKLALKQGEVGSSAMPHKVNPIDFENAEGNLGLSNALLHHMASKLPVSRLQRDLSDSTVLRSLGVPMGHAMLALQSASKGLAKCLPNQAAIEADLNDNTSVVAEAYQVILRREGFENGYEILKELTRNHERPTLLQLQEAVFSLPLSEAAKAELRAITPQTYTGFLPAHHRKA